MLMTQNNVLYQYKENSIYTATPEELTLMLYNGLIKFIMQAQSGLEAKDTQKAHLGIIKAQNILDYLQKTLDKQYEVSYELDMLYDYMIRRLVEANIKKDNEILTEVLGFARELRDTWSQAMKLAKHQSRSRQAAR
jgi:flagellar protein FliS